MKQKFNRGGRPPKLNPAAYRYVVRFDAAENNVFLSLFEKSGATNKAAFIKSVLLGKPFKVFTVDENTRVFIDRLAALNAQYRTFVIDYDRFVDMLRQHFTEKRALALLYKLEQTAIEMVGGKPRDCRPRQRVRCPMVAKISVGSSLYGALSYNGEKINKEKGRVLDTNKIFNDGSGNIDIHRAFEDFKLWMPQSTRAEKTMMHISLNPHPDDRLSEGQYAQLAREYMEKMGFGDMPYLIVKHEDIDRHHIHIVALRGQTRRLGYLRQEQLLQEQGHLP